MPLAIKKIINQTKPLRDSYRCTPKRELNSVNRELRELAAKSSYKNRSVRTSNGTAKLSLHWGGSTDREVSPTRHALNAKGDHREAVERHPLILPVARSEQ